MNGFTEEEQYLNELGCKSFLRFWSWPNLFRDQGQSSGKGDGKEICDLTVIFGSSILLFSDKRVEYNRNKEKNVAWGRWARKAIGGSVKQIQGAKRWFVNHPDRIFLDKDCSVSIPIKLPSPDEYEFHYIVVCHGIEEVLLENYPEPSFSFDNSIVGSEHWNSELCEPFALGKISETEFIHVFNEATISLILQEFDTARDFISYLKQRRLLFEFDKRIKVKSESDIVQLYYENFDDEKLENSILNAKELRVDEPVVDKGGIANIYSNPIFSAKKINDEDSYFWDGLIESFSFHIFNGTSQYGNWDAPSDIEPSLRLMAQTGRFERRVLSQAFIEFYKKVVPGQRGTRVIFDPINKGQAFLFMMLPFDSSFGSLERYREVRRKMLEDYCLINKLKSPHITHFIGVACKTRDADKFIDDSFYSEGQDFIFVDTSFWNDEREKEAQEIHDEYVANGLLAKTMPFMSNLTDFPMDNEGKLEFGRNIDVKGKDRNKPCICGSGKKLKKCCGSA